MKLRQGNSNSTSPSTSHCVHTSSASSTWRKRGRWGGGGGDRCDMLDITFIVVVGEHSDNTKANCKSSSRNRFVTMSVHYKSSSRNRFVTKFVHYKSSSRNRFVTRSVHYKSSSRNRFVTKSVHYQSSSRNRFVTRSVHYHDVCTRYQAWKEWQPPSYLSSCIKEHIVHAGN